MNAKRVILSGVILATAAGGSITAQNAPAAGLTFNKDVAPIIFNNCVTCHRPNQVAPMSLMSYKEVRPWARAIKDKVTKGEMPPWFADPRYGEFRNDRRLSAEQVRTIAAWVDGGAPQGETPLTVELPAFNDGWSHPSGRPPDFVVEMADAFNAPAEGELPNFNVYQELPAELKKEDHFVEAIQILPSVIPAVHHSSFAVKSLPPGTKIGPGEAWPGGQVIAGALLNAKTGKLAGVASGDVNEAEALEGVSRPRAPAAFTEFNYCCYVPGGSFMQYRQGAGKRIPKDGYIIWGLHYTMIGKPFADRTRVGLWFQREMTYEIIKSGGGGDRANIILGEEIVHDKLHPVVGKGPTAVPAVPVIPPHAKNWAITAIRVFQDDVRLYTVWPHMHTRGKEMAFVLTYPDGREHVVLSVPKYDFNWQMFYELKEPIQVPAGSTIKTVGSYDNSAANRWVAAPQKEVYWSEQSWDEMYNGFTEVSFDKLDFRLMKTSAKSQTAGGGQ